MSPGFALIGIPIFGSILLMILFAWGLDYFFKKIKFKIHFLYSFTFSYFLISLVLLYFQYQQPPSEYFGIPIFAGPMILSYPLGMIPFLTHISGVPVNVLVLVSGSTQWCLVAFLYQKLIQNKRSIWAVLFWLLAVSILGILLFIAFKFLLSR